MRSTSDQLPDVHAEHLGDSPDGFDGELVRAPAALDRAHLAAGERGEDLDVPLGHAGALAQGLDAPGDGAGELGDAFGAVGGHRDHAGNCQPEPQPARTVSPWKLERGNGGRRWVPCGSAPAENTPLELRALLEPIVRRFGVARAYREDEEVRVSGTGYAYTRGIAPRSTP